MEKMERKKIHTIVVGSGAAGYNAADRLYQYGETDVALVTENRLHGTSRNTGSDKQTYYKLSLSGGQDDSVDRLAQVLFSGGCMDGEHALCEAALSAQGFYKLSELGVPFPHNYYGEYVGYKTDHDPNHRGTSVGPYTSKYMTEALERSVDEKGITVYDHHQVIRILTHKARVYGILCLNTKDGGYVLFECANLVWATGGPAGIYQDSVYPASQFGSTGLALEAGAGGKNLTEWQYGLASLKPRWNVSGSYMQVLPRFVSTDCSGGDEKEFLTEYFDSREHMMDMVFLKGYQWPFDARKAADGSSVIDLLVYRETCQRGRRVWLDYRNNPGGGPVDFSLLSDETREYLKQAGACQGTPFERLLQLNEPAVSFYREHGVDLEKEMLEVSVCAQHNNGGISVNEWWETQVEGFFAVGEAAGTHGIYRPGGSALNSGQVGSTRAASYIAAHRDPAREWTKEESEAVLKQVEERILMGEKWRQMDGKFAALWKEAAARMSRCGAMVRDLEEIRAGIKAVDQKLEWLRNGQGEDAVSEEGIPAASKDPAGFGCSELPGQETAAARSRVFRYYDMLLCQKLYLSAMEDYISHGGKSRGSAVYPVLEGAGITIPGLISFSLDGEDGLAHAGEVQEIYFSQEDGTCVAGWRPVHPIPKRNDIFEVVWREYREGFAKR